MTKHTISLPVGDVLEVTATGASVPEPVPPMPSSSGCLGLNLAGPDDWNSGARAKLFNDLWLTARCISGDPKTGPSVWRVLTSSNGARWANIAGTYTLVPAGGGAVTAAGGSFFGNVLTVASKDVDVDVKFSAPLTGIPKLLRDTQSTMTTTPEFRAFAKPFAFIRFMDLMVTNWADQPDALLRATALGSDGLMQWPERPSDAGPYHRPWGISIEAAIRICNECNVDMWLNLTHVASDQMFTGIAAELKAKLDPALSVYIEFSNETWNYAGGFYHSTLVKDMALQHIASGATPRIDTPTDNDWYYAQRYTLMRLRRAWEIISAQIGGRCRPIFASQFASGYFGNALMWSKRTFGNNDWLYGLACAPYIYADTGTVDQIIATLTTDYQSREKAGSKLAQMRALCDGHLKNNNLFFYEVGIDMGQGDTNLQNRLDASYDGRMAPLVAGFLTTNFLWGGVKGAAWFNGCSTHDKWGPAWGLTDDATDLAQPMYTGACAFARIGVPSGGITAQFFAKPDFTSPLETKVVPLINHAWVAWSTAPLHHGQNPTWTEGKDGSIRFTGKYRVRENIKGLAIEYEANDQAQLITSGTFTPGSLVDVTVNYVARFSGNGSCYIRLMEVYADGTKKLVTQERLTP